MSQALEVVQFYDDQLTAVRRHGYVYVAVTRCCQALGLNEQRQYRSILNDPRFSGYTIWYTLAKGAQSLFLRTDALHGWLNRINSAKVKPAARDKLLRYQRECSDVLNRYFNGTLRTGHKIDGPSREELLDQYQDVFALPGAYGERQSSFGLEPFGIAKPLPIQDLEEVAQARADRTGVPIEVLRVLFWQVALRDRRELLAIEHKT